jgi:hypothetical protein
MVRPKGTSYDAVVKDLPQTFCDILTCGQMAELIVEDDNGLWLCFCGKHNPQHMIKQIVYPKDKLKNKK